MDLGVLSFLPASQRALKALVLAAIVFGAMSTSLFAQRQASNWVFGRGAAVNFGPPVSTSRQVHFWAIEPAATWSDPTTGRLVLYTDGQRVYN